MDTESVEPHSLSRDDRRQFERLLCWLRLSFILSAGFVLLAFGPAATGYALLITGAVACSFVWVRLLDRYAPATLLRWQLALRLVDCVLVFAILVNYHAFLHDAYYDAVYLLFVVAAAATHGRHGAALVGLFAGLAVLASRVALMRAGALPAVPRQVTDALFFTVFFLVTGYAVAYLMERSGESVARRDALWRRQMEARTRALEEAAAARDRALEAAHAAVRTRDELVALVSHDLRNPLTVLMGSVHLLREATAREGEQGSLPVSALTRRLDAIQRSAYRMVAQMDELLDIARLQGGRPLDLQLDKIDLVALARAAVEDRLQNPGGHHVTLAAPEPPLDLVGDPVRLGRVLDNLLSNALKYSPPESEVSVQVAQEGAFATISVRDRGRGIPLQDQPRLFEPFFRASNAAGVVGNGVGLAAVRQIVERHGGAVYVESVPGTGSTFRVCLPLRATPNLSVAPEPHEMHRLPAHECAA